MILLLMVMQIYEICFTVAKTINFAETTTVSLLLILLSESKYLNVVVFSLLVELVCQLGGVSEVHVLINQPVHQQ